MKRLIILQIVRAFGAVSISDLVIVGRDWGDPFLPCDLLLIEGMVRENLLMLGRDGKVRRPTGTPMGGTPKMVRGLAEKAVSEKSEELLHHFGDGKEFTVSKVMRDVDLDRQNAKSICDKLLTDGKLKVKRMGISTGKVKVSFPYYQVVQ